MKMVTVQAGEGVHEPIPSCTTAPMNTISTKPTTSTTPQHGLLVSLGARRCKGYYRAALILERDEDAIISRGAIRREDAGESMEIMLCVGILCLL